MWPIAAEAGVDFLAGAMQAESTRVNAHLIQQVDDLNAQYADVDAYNQVQAGVTKSARYQDVVNQTIGAQQGAEAAKGVDVNFGTAAEVGAESKISGMLNQMDIKRQAEMNAMGYKTQAINLRLAGATGEAQQQETAQAEQIGGGLRGVSSGLSGYAKYGKTPDDTKDY